MIGDIEINREHRIVYEVDSNVINILSIKGDYKI